MRWPVTSGAFVGQARRDRARSAHRPRVRHRRARCSRPSASRNVPMTASSAYSPGATMATTVPATFGGSRHFCTMPFGGRGRAEDRSAAHGLAAPHARRERERSRRRRAPAGLHVDRFGARRAVAAGRRRCGRAIRVRGGSRAACRRPRRWRRVAVPSCPRRPARRFRRRRGARLRPAARRRRRAPLRAARTVPPPSRAAPGPEIHRIVARLMRRISRCFSRLAPISTRSATSPASVRVDDVRRRRRSSGPRGAHRRQRSAERAPQVPCSDVAMASRSSSVNPGACAMRHAPRGSTRRALRRRHGRPMPCAPRAAASDRTAPAAAVPRPAARSAAASRCSRNRRWVSRPARAAPTPAANRWRSSSNASRMRCRACDAPSPASPRRALAPRRRSRRSGARDRLSTRSTSACVRVSSVIAAPRARAVRAGAPRDPAARSRRAGPARSARAARARVPRRASRAAESARRRTRRRGSGDALSRAEASAAPLRPAAGIATCAPASRNPAAVASSPMYQSVDISPAG